MEDTEQGPSSSSRCARQIAVLVYPDVLLLDVTGPVQVFATANDVLALENGGLAPGYRIELVAPRAGAITSSSGVRLIADRRYTEASHPIDTLLVAGGLGVRELLENKALIHWIKESHLGSNRIASVCTGAFLLAAAGLLDGRRAVTHWAHCGELAERFPGIAVEPDSIFVRDGRVYSSAGVSAGMDLALALVEEDWGRDVALAVARRMVLFLKRPGGQSQFSCHLRAQTAERGRLRDVQGWILDNLAADLSVPTLADRVAMSPRNFARAFVSETGMTPAKFVETARLEAACRLLEAVAKPVEAVAVECGFGNAERMRRSFQRHMQVGPAAYRDRFKSAADQAAGQGAD